MQKGQTPSFSAISRRTRLGSDVAMFVSSFEIAGIDEPGGERKGVAPASRNRAHGEKCNFRPDSLAAGPGRRIQILGCARKSSARVRTTVKGKRFRRVSTRCYAPTEASMNEESRTHHRAWVVATITLVILARS